MGKCIKIIKDKIDVSKVIKQLRKILKTGDHQKHIEDVQSLLDRGFDDLPVRCSSTYNGW
jgi:hypothetical protein